MENKLTMRNCDLLQKTTDNTLELTKLIKKSPKREAKLKQIQKSLSHLDEESETKPSVSMLCPTRWTVREKTLESIIKN